MYIYMGGVACSQHPNARDGGDGGFVYSTRTSYALNFRCVVDACDGLLVVTWPLCVRNTKSLGIALLRHRQPCCEIDGLECRAIARLPLSA